jgi:nitrite reductase (NO-forming)
MSEYTARTTLGGTVEQKTDSKGIGPLAAVTVILLGIAVAVLVLVAVVVANWANDARGDANVAAAKATALAEHGTHAGAATGTGIRSYAGMAPANAAALAKAHSAFPAELPPLTAGPMVQVQLTLVDRTVQVAPGIKYSAWGFAGGVPGPVIHVRQGQMVHVTLTNKGMMPHSVDFHSARIAPNRAFVDVMPGASKTFSFVANDPGVFMYHCGTKPVLMHIANGMYGAIVVEPKTALPKADKEYVLVSSEWYLSSPGLKTPAQFDMEKAHLSMPDWVTWNGYAGQYVTHPVS